MMQRKRKSRQRSPKRYKLSPTSAGRPNEIRSQSKRKVQNVMLKGRRRSRNQRQQSRRYVVVVGSVLINRRLRRRKITTTRAERRSDPRADKPWPRLPLPPGRISRSVTRSSCAWAILIRQNNKGKKKKAKKEMSSEEEIEVDEKEKDVDAEEVKPKARAASKKVCICSTRLLIT
jgi:hypothetical protein